jgi:hypothetical protein
MKKLVLAPTLVAALLVTSCAPASQEATSPSAAGATATASQAVTAQPSPTTTKPPASSPAAIALPSLGKPLAFLDPADYTSGVLPAPWLGGAGWRAGLLKQGSEISSTFAAYTATTPANDQTLAVTTGTGDIIYQSPSLNLDPEQKVEPSLYRMLQNEQEFFVFYQMGVPLEPASAQEAGKPVAQLIIVDSSGKATTVEEDVTKYRPVASGAKENAVAFTATDGGLAMQQDPKTNAQNTEPVRVLNPETAELEPIPEMKGMTWLSRNDGVDVFRSPKSADPEGDATIGTREWSTPFADRSTNGSVFFGPAFMTVQKLDDTCETYDLHTGDLITFQGALNGCAFAGGNLHSYDSASSPNGQLVLMRWNDSQNVESRWIVDMETGVQKQIDPSFDFHPSVISNTGDVYGSSSDGRTGYLKFPDQMEPQFHEEPNDLPSGITDDGLALFKNEYLPAFFGISAE